eukprot:2187-Heterococcus_DN1.PRE.1
MAAATPCLLPAATADVLAVAAAQRTLSSSATPFHQMMQHDASTHNDVHLHAVLKELTEELL